VYVDEEGLILVQFQPFHVMSFGMFDRQRTANNSHRQQIKLGIIPIFLD